jgi:thioredoxin reductase (NADPH)
VLTKDDVGAIPDFSTLPPALIERLAQRSADLSLSVGECAVAEGGERALFAVSSPAAMCAPAR